MLRTGFGFPAWSVDFSSSEVLQLISKYHHRGILFGASLKNFLRNVFPTTALECANSHKATRIRRRFWPRIISSRPHDHGVCDLFGPYWEIWCRTGKKDRQSIVDWRKRRFETSNNFCKIGFNHSLWFHRGGWVNRKVQKRTAAVALMEGGFGKFN